MLVPDFSQLSVADFLGASMPQHVGVDVSEVTRDDLSPAAFQKLVIELMKDYARRALIDNEFPDGLRFFVVSDGERVRVARASSLGDETWFFDEVLNAHADRMEAVWAIAGDQCQSISCTVEEIVAMGGIDEARRRGLSHPSINWCMTLAPVDGSGRVRTFGGVEIENGRPVHYRSTAGADAMFPGFLHALRNRPNVPTETFS